MMASSLHKNRFGFLVLGVAVVAATFALAGQLSAALVEASTPGGVALSGIAGVALGLWAAKDFRGALLGGGAVGFVNAFVGIGTAMIVRDATLAVLVGGCLGGGVLGAITGGLSHLLVLVAQRR